MAGDCPRTWLAELAERLAPLEVALGVDEMAVSLDVPVLAADDEQDEVAVADARDLPRRRRLDVAEAAGAELPHLAVDLESCRAAVHEVELVLPVVVVQEPVEAGRHHERVDAEGRHAERPADL